jgi:CelD/BcsL family acetyltransferase involved in cellulose biosynthesis
LKQARIATEDSRPFWVESCPAGDVPASWHPPWDALAHTASEPNVFAERWFFEPAAHHLAAPGETHLLAAWSADENGSVLLGLLPLRLEPRYGRSPVPHVENWRHHHAFLGTPLIRAGREAEFWAAILAELDQAPWAKGFLYLTNLVEDGPVHRGLAEAAAGLGRRCATVYRFERAMLASSLSPEAYFEAALRNKKRKELRRLSARLAELGKVEFATLGPGEDVGAWCDSFLALEASGWKGRSGTALAQFPDTEAFFRAALKGAHDAGRLEALALRLDGKPIAMLVNLVAPPGAFSFKIAIDEDFARFSPGVLLQIENLRMLDRPELEWADSCAVEDHKMINSLWRERRRIVRVSVPLSGARRRAIFAAARLAENGSALLRRFKRPNGART